MATLRQTPLRERHEALGATMTGFGGWEMPLDYGSVVAEHTAVRDACGVFDLSHLGNVVVTGPDAQAVLQHALTNDVAALDIGTCQYTLCLDDDAGIVDDLILSRMPVQGQRQDAAGGYLAVPNAANTAAVAALLRASAEGRDCDIVDVKDRTACLAVQGRESARVLDTVGIDTSGMDYMHGREVPLPASFAGDRTGPAAPVSGLPFADDAALVTRTGYTGERGYEVVVAADRAAGLWDALVAAGGTPAGLGCRDTLRLEMGYPLHGNDISRDTTPVEARLGWAVKAGTGFRGEDAYKRAKEDGRPLRLQGLRALARGIPRAGQTVTVDASAGAHGRRPVGRTTSGSFSPTLKVGIALAYLDAQVAVGDAVEVDVRGRPLSAQVVRPPFVEASPKG